MKESNRIHAIEQLLSVIGVEVKQEGDDLEISGAGSDFVFNGGEFKSFGDHRIAMCAAISAVRSSDEVFIDDIQNVRTSFPNFFTYKVLEVMDAPSENLERYFNEVSRFISRAIKSGGKVFVHCHAGVSRSATFVIAYLMFSHAMTLESATLMCRSARR